MAFKRSAVRSRLSPPTRECEQKRTSSGCPFLLPFRLENKVIFCNINHSASPHHMSGDFRFVSLTSNFGNAYPCDNYNNADGKSKQNSVLHFDVRPIE
ncbi:MAG: hypothetical protein J6A62_02345, partial [Oscillospiraceae bacterium]|nr:hypothetical protein [Oscillospiraceae bacterium]